MRLAEMTDPGPFLSTIAECSATLVAIVGGLLVARFVTLTSEREGVQKLIEEADSRLTTARNREEAARRRLYRWDVREFFGYGVLYDIRNGRRDVRELRADHGYTPLTDDEMEEAIASIVDEFSRAHTTLSQLVAAENGGYYPEWDEFRLSQPQLPVAQWDHVWDIEYEALVRPPKRVEQPSYLATTVSSIALPMQPEYVKLSAERRDALQVDLERAAARIQDIDEGITHLQRRREAIARPRGLGLGLIVLGYFTLVGVGIPLFILSGSPQNMSSTQTATVFWFFASGLALLLGYMTVLAIRLSSWREKR